MSMNPEARIANRVSFFTLLINVLLSVGKLLAGVLAHSGAMVSDAVHSASDVFSTLIVIVGINISKKDADKDHPYGHEKLEAVVAILLAFILFLTAYGIFRSGLHNVQQVIKGEEIAIPGILALLAAVISIGVKEWMYWYTQAAAKKIQSAALMADAWHHRSDALSSIGSLLGIGGAMLGIAILDPVASLLICIMIAKVAFDIGRTAINQIVDKAADDQTVEQIHHVVLSTAGVIGIDDLKTRMHVNKMYVDVEVCMDGSLSLDQAHEIAEQVHEKVEKQVENVKHCMVHVNPDHSKKEEKPID